MSTGRKGNIKLAKNSYLEKIDAIGNEETNRCCASSVGANGESVLSLENSNKYLSLTCMVDNESLPYMPSVST